MQWHAMLQRENFNFFCLHFRDVKIEYKILKEKVREYNKKDAQFYGSIFAEMNKVEQARTAGAKQESVPMVVDSKA